jgi:alkylation response protein AidB-like acyl-CoA dehydrogenase
MSVMMPDVSRQPLTLLSEEEQMFRDMVRQFAEESVAPLVHDMDRDAQMNADLIPQCFELGLMGIEIRTDRRRRACRSPRHSTTART